MHIDFYPQLYMLYFLIIIIVIFHVILCNNLSMYVDNAHMHISNVLLYLYPCISIYSVLIQH